MNTTLDEQLRKVIADGESLARLADRAAPIAKDLRLDGRHKSLVELAARGRDKNFQIIFAGEFNSGKSTAINALLGEPVMPMKVVEANAILTKIRYRLQKRAVLYPADGGTQREVPYAEFAQHIVVDRKDRKKASPWKSAELFYPLEILKQGIIIVDPPGTNALPERQLLTVVETENSDAAVYLLFAGQPFKESERGFIVGCLDAKETFWLVTHADFLDEEGVAEVREDLERNLREIRPYDETIPHRIFFVDAKRAQIAAARLDDRDLAASGMKEFFRALGNFISGDRHRAKMQDLCAQLGKILDALDQAAESQRRDTERAHEDVVKRYEKLKTEIAAARKEADIAVTSLTSHMFPLAETVRKMVRFKIRSLPGAPPFGASDIVMSETVTFRMDFSFDQEKKERLIEEVRAQVVRRIQQDLRDWFRSEVVRDIETDMKTGLETFDQARVIFENRLASIRQEYLQLPPGRPGHTPAVPELEAAGFADVISRTVRSITGALQIPTRAMRRSFEIWLNTPYGDDGAGTWADARAKATGAFAQTVSRMIVEQIAELADDLADTANAEMLSWCGKVEAAAGRSISDPRIDLEKTAQEGERTSRLQAQEKQDRRGQLDTHQAELTTLRQEQAVLQARYGTR